MIKKMIKRLLNPVDITRIDSPITDSTMGTGRGTPIDRYYIENFLKNHEEDIRGDILEVGESTYSKKFHSGANDKFYTLDFSKDKSQYNQNFNLELPEQAPATLYDCFISTHTLNFTFDIASAIKTTAQTLKHNGVLLCTVASYTQLSEYDDSRWGDYWRFSETTINKLFEKNFPGKFTVTSYGNFSSSLGVLHGLCLEDLPDRSILEHKQNQYTNVIAVRAIKN
jgi:hypothetical protein